MNRTPGGYLGEDGVVPQQRGVNIIEKNSDKWGTGHLELLCFSLEKGCRGFIGE